MMSIVKQISYDHHWQDRLISVLYEITRIPRPDRSDLHTVEKYNVGMGRFWDVLPAFNYSVLEGGWHQAPWDVPVRSPEEANGKALRSWSPSQWLNTNAFMARCTGSRIPGAAFPRAALQVLNHTLELPRTPDGLDVYVPAATVWMLYAGRGSYENEDDDDRVRGVALGTDETTVWLYKGPEGYCRERWDFWKKRFKEEMDNVEGKEETRIFAKRAFDETVRIEGGSSNTGDEVHNTKPFVDP
jgi:hypothetical protein